MSAIDRLICHVMPRAFVMALVAGWLGGAVMRRL